MKYSCSAVAAFSLVFSAAIFADNTYYAPGAQEYLMAQSTPKPVNLSSQPRQINSVNATGEKQSAIVDQNGSLRMVERVVAAEHPTLADADQSQGMPMQNGPAPTGQPAQMQNQQAPGYKPGVVPMPSQPGGNQVPTINMYPKGPTAAQPNAGQMNPMQPGQPGQIQPGQGPQQPGQMQPGQGPQQQPGQSGQFGPGQGPQPTEPMPPGYTPPPPPPVQMQPVR